MLQIAIWGLAAITALLGMLVYQVGKSSTRSQEPEVMIGGAVALIAGFAVAGLLIWLANGQASSIGDMLPAY